LYNQEYLTVCLNYALEYFDNKVVSIDSSISTFQCRTSGKAFG